MPATNEEFIKKAFDAGLSEEQVRSAVAERNKLRAGATPALQPTMQQPQGNFMTNFLPSLGRNIQDIGEGLVNVVNPNVEQNTVANLLKLVAGTGQKIIPGQQGQEQYFDATADFYKNRYGSVDNFKKTINNDPVGFLLDASTVLTAGGAAVGKVGQVGKVGKLAKAGQVIAKAGQLLDPVQSGLMLAGKGADVAGKSRIGQKVQAPFKNAYNVDAVQTAQELGIDLPISARTNSKVIKGYEALLQKGLFGGKVGQKIEKARVKIAQLGDDLTARFDTAPDLKATGNVIKQGFTKYQDDFNQMKGEMYDAIPDSVAKTPADLTKTRQALSEIIKNKQGSLVGGTNINYYTDLLNRLDDQKNPVTLDNIRKTRTIVGQQRGNFADPIATGDKASLNKLYASLSDDIDTTINTADPAYGQALTKANEYYKKNLTKINSSIGKKIASTDPEKLVDDLIKPNSETAVMSVREVIGEKAFSNLQESFLQRIITKSIDQKTKRLDLKKLNTQLDKYGEPTIAKLLSKEQRVRLDDIKTQLGKIDSVDQTIKSGTKMADGSQTAFLGEIGFIGGTGAVNPLFTAQYITGKWLANTMYNSQRGQKYLTTGVDLTSPVVSKLQQSAQLVQKARPATSVVRSTQQAGNEQFDAIRRAQERLNKKQSSKYAPLP